MKRIFEKSCGETDQRGGGGDRKEAGSKRGPGAAVGRAAFTWAQGRARRPVAAPGLLGQAPVRSRRARLGRPGCHGRLPCSAHGRLSTCRASSASRSLGAAAPACGFSRTALGVLYGGRRRLNPSPPFIRTCERRTCPDLSRLPKQIPLPRDATRRWPRQRPDRGPLPPRPAPRAPREGGGRTRSAAPGALGFSSPTCTAWSSPRPRAHGPQTQSSGTAGFGLVFRFALVKP